MAQIAGMVMFAMFLVFGAGLIAGIEIVRRGGALMLVPALGVWLIALLALATVGVMAAILATRN